MNQDDIHLVLRGLQEQIATLKQDADNKRGAGEITLHPEIAQGVPPHMQCKGLSAADRAGLLRPYPKIADLDATADVNGLATQGMPAAQKLTVTKDLVAYQRSNLDVVRVAASTLQHATDQGIDASYEQRFGWCVDALRAICTLAADNAQQAAERQLNICLEHAGAKGAGSLLDRSPESDTMDWTDHNIFQQAHIAATVTEAAAAARRGGRRRGGGRGGRSGANAQPAAGPNEQ